MGGTISFTQAPDTLRALAGECASVDALPDEVVHALQRRENAARLDRIRTRIRRSRDDPRPSLGIGEVEAHMEALFAQARDERRRA